MGKNECMNLEYAVKLKEKFESTHAIKHEKIRLK